ncbi:MAG: UDP-N-acetylmuramoyl-tripeptide--D-alanyl-D-alanine ligase [Leptolyngbyaceae bacterium]|nr:UDP-N-acetylmuramoyl-tripeptide--D-alanyl-D-alanine ligase [Leptolyngbyaceae bacterium]
MSMSLALSTLVPLVNGVEVNAVSASAFPSLVVSGISTDSRTLAPGDLFIALEGEHFDGHGFVEGVAKAGAIAALVHRVPPNLEAITIPVIQVQDTLVAYQAIARYWRQQFQIPIVAITGSVGKTTTKELLAAVLSTQGQVLKTQANYNNEVGVPKTLLQLDTHHDYAVIEMGMRGLGEIAELAQIALPDVALITNVGTAHIGRLGSEEAIAQAKCELLEYLPSHGTAVLNHDNLRLTQTAMSVWSGATLTYGLEGGDIRGTLDPANPEEMIVEGLTDQPVTVALPLTGRHNALNYLGTLVVAAVLKLDLTAILSGITVALPSGRAQRYHLSNDVTILDETYNAGVESMMAALRLLKDTPGKRHIAVLGTMKELGEWSVDLHRRVGTAARELQLDGLITLADPPEEAALMAGAAPIPAYPCTTAESVVNQLKYLVQPGDRILFKASRAVGLEQVMTQFQQYWASCG